EDGIRYFHVTGVPTCALPIYGRHQPPPLPRELPRRRRRRHRRDHVRHQPGRGLRRRRRLLPRRRHRGLRRRARPHVPHERRVVPLPDQVALLPRRADLAGVLVLRFQRHLHLGGPPPPRLLAVRLRPPHRPARQRARPGLGGQPGHRLPHDVHGGGAGHLGRPRGRHLLGRPRRPRPRRLRHPTLGG